MNDLDPGRYPLRTFEGRGFRQSYLHLGAGGVPLLLVHGWPETKRIWWKVVEPLAFAGFEIIAPDLRGFGDSDVAEADGAAAYAVDLHALVTEGLGHERVVAVGGDLGGALAQDLARRFPGFVERLVLFNCPLPYDKEAFASLDHRSPRSAMDYAGRHAEDPDGLAAELDTPEQRRRYVATFYGPRFWAHPGSFASSGPVGVAPFGGNAEIDFHTEPFGDAQRFRASLDAYRPGASRDLLLDRNDAVEALILFGPSDHVIFPDFDRMAALMFPNHVGPFLLRDCGHFVPWEAPSAFVGAVRTFARDLVAPHAPPRVPADRRVVQA